MKRAASTVFCITLAVLLASGVSAVQDPATSQITYYVDSLGPDDGKSAIFRVQLDETLGVANLEQFVLLDDATWGLGPWNNVDVLAATPDGERLYFINDGGNTGSSNGKLGYYDIAIDSVGVVGQVTYNNVGATLPDTNTSDQGAIGVDGAMYITRVGNEMLYRLDLNTATASAIGVFRNAANFGQVDLQGADIAFDAQGRLFIWANYDAPLAPSGLYAAVSTTLPASGDILVNHLGPNIVGNGIFYSGLAFLNAGFGELVASSPQDVFHRVTPTTGAPVRTYTPKVNGADFDTGNGDMTTAQLGVQPGPVCTFTIGYWKNHEWPGSIRIGNDEITEEEGRFDPGYLRRAKGNNFSMFYAQLIAAKLNCPSCFDVWGDAEQFLVDAGVTEATYDSMFASKQQKSEANALKDALDEFNNSMHCNQ